LKPQTTQPFEILDGKDYIKDKLLLKLFHCKSLTAAEEKLELLYEQKT